MQDITEELYYKKYPNTPYSGNINMDVKNNKIELGKILKALGMKGILEDDKYLIKNEKIFPIHFQILCKTLLEQNRSKKNDFIYKLKKHRFADITDTEIKMFIYNLKVEFSNWFNLLEFTPLNKNERSKEELDEIYFNIEEQMIEDETTEYIDNLEDENIYTTNEVEYLKTKFSIRQQENVLIESVENNLYYKCKIVHTIMDIHRTIDQIVDEKLDLKSIMENMVLLNDYDSDLIGTVPIPKICIKNGNQEYQLSTKCKSVFLEELYQDIRKCLDLFGRCTDTFVKNNSQSTIVEDCKIQYTDIRDELILEMLEEYNE